MVSKIDKDIVVFCYNWYLIVNMNDCHPDEIDASVGLLYTPKNDGYYTYKIVDMNLFMLAKIKYGI